ncbi:hypothetical protein SDC9_199019 [bioreactor metagenome]|uniref:Uncharacterized protein n=1 Tax=bioreactor metagenome TaxID=1076179 RepID=A0A645IJA8_9ZZZZ
MRQQRLVRSAAVDGAAGEQRGLEPAAMLVGPFEIEIGRMCRYGSMRAAQDMPVRRAGVEPDVEGILHLDVLPGLGPEQFGGIETEPGFDAGLLDALCNQFDQLGSTRMRLAGFLVQEERDRYAPIALA